MKRNLAHGRAHESTAAFWLADYEPADGHGKVGHPIEATALFGPDVVLDAFEAGHDHAEAGWTIERSTGQTQLDGATALMREAADLFRSYQKHHAARAVAEPDLMKRGGSIEKAARNALMAARLEAWLAGEDTYPVSTDAILESGAELLAIHATAEVDASGTGSTGISTQILEGQTSFTGYLTITTNVTATLDFPGELSLTALMVVDEAAPAKEGGSNVRPVTIGPLSEPGVADGVASALGLVEPAAALSLATEAVFRLQTPDPRFDPRGPVRVNGYLFHPATEAQ